MEIKTFNITAQVYKNSDLSKQNLLINQVIVSLSSQQALDSFKLDFPNIEYSLVKVLSIEQCEAI